MAVLSGTSQYRQRWLIIVFVGFAARLAWIFTVPVHPVSDSAVYDQLAWNLASRGAYAWNNGVVTAYWPVGTAFTYSLLFRLFGHTLAPIAVLNVIIGAFSIGLAMALARRWSSNNASLVAGAIYAFWPSQIEFSSVLASELLFNFVLLLALWMSVASPVRSWWLRGLLAGICLAGAAYVRPTALPLVALLVAALSWTASANWRAVARFAFAALVAMAFCVAPWTLRNERELGAPVLISTNGPANLWMGNNPVATGAYIPLPDDVARLSEVDRSRLLGARAKQFILQHPGRAASLFLRKLIVTHDRETIGITWNESSLAASLGNTGVRIAKAISTAYWWLALAFGASGVVLLLLRYRLRGLLHPALLAWGYFALVHAATVGADRYHFPSIPFIAMLAGFAASYLRRERRTNTLTGSSAPHAVPARKVA